jgi:hypothetical protein
MADEIEEEDRRRSEETGIFGGGSIAAGTPELVPGCRWTVSVSSGLLASKTIPSYHGHPPNLHAVLSPPGVVST